MSAQSPEIGEFFQAIVKGPITMDDVAAAYHAAARLRTQVNTAYVHGDRDLDIIERLADALMRCVPMEETLLPPTLRGVLDAGDSAR